MEKYLYFLLRQVTRYFQIFRKIMKKFAWLKKNEYQRRYLLYCL